MLKKLSALIIAITIILVNTNCVNASVLDIGTVATGLNGAFNLADSNEKKRSDISNWLHQNSDWAGFLFDPVSMSGFLTPSVIYSVLPQNIKDQISDSSDDSEVLNKTIDMILEGQSVSGNNITNNTNVNTFLKNIQNNYVSLNDYITVFAFNLNDNSNAVYWSDTAHLQAIKDLCNQYQNDYYIFYYGSNLYNQATQLIIGLSKNDYVFSQSKSGLSTLTEADMYYMSYGLNKSGNAIYGNPGPSNVLVWQYDKTNQVYIDGTWNYQQIGLFPAQFIFGKSNVYLGPASTMNSYWQSDTGNQTKRKGKFVSVGKEQAVIYKAYETYAQYPNGVMPYYYNNTVWQDFSNSSGDYTFSPSNINTVTYGDTVSFINDYHDTNNNYPDNSTVNNWINTTNNNNTSGGGSGSGGDDSGGGSGSGSGSGSDGIFDFLSDLGSVLGNLISNLGQAITNIIKGISDLVTSIVSDLPTVFFDFIGSIFGWLPEEWVTLLSLSLAAMLIWGIVKVIRG